MSRIGNLWLVPVLSALLVTAQAFWASAIKHDRPFAHPFGEAMLQLCTSPKVWVGGLLYVTATLVYFLMLSHYAFFSVQVGMTALSIVLSTLLAVVLFKEKITPINVIGMVTVIAGISMVFQR